MIPTSPSWPTPDQARDRLERAARSDDRAERSFLTSGLEVAYRRLVAGAAGSTAKPGGPGAGEAEDFAATLARGLVETDDGSARKATAKRLAASYLDAHRRASAASEQGTSYGGRSGRVAFAGKGSFLEPNPRLVGFVETFFGGAGAGPGQRSPECRECGYRIDVRKPQGTTAAGGAGLDPTFAAYLRRTDQGWLISLERWAAHHGTDPADPAVEAAYDAALESATETFERGIYEERYCQPADLPASNTIRGHRLLRLDPRLCAEDFRPQCEGAVPAIYEGAYGPPTPPVLDYDELVRRYVQQLRQETAPSSRPIGEGEIAAVVVGLGFAPEQTALFVQASGLALHLHDLGFWERLRTGIAPAGAASSAAILGSGRQGISLVPPPVLAPPGLGPLGASTSGSSGASSTPAGWLLGSAGQSVRSAVERLWRGLLPEPPVQGGARIAAGVPSEAVTVGELRARLEKLALIQRTPAYRDEFYPRDGEDRLGATIRERLVRVYEAVWLAARATLGEEALQARMLAGAELQIEFGPRELEAYLYHLARAAFSNNSWIGLGYGDPTRDLSDNPPVPVSRAELEAFFATVDVSNLQRGDWYTAQAQAFVDRVVASYEHALDVLLTLSGPAPAPAATVAPTGPAALTRSDIGALYHLWAQLFWRVVDQLSRVRLPVGETLLVLRLAQRSGRFGEVPRRSQSGELEPEPKSIPWPGHPRTQTEGWMLEPVPEPYYRRHHPGVYLQELHAISLRSRGFGIGRNLYSVSLFPGEDQKVVIKSIKDTTYTVTESTAENVFEESSSETERDFGKEVARESERESTSEEAGHVGVKVSGGVPFFSGSTDASYDAKSGVRDFAKDVSNVTSKLASKLSAKQSVSVETKRSSEQKVELHAELSTERSIKNPNLGHTVTFHWFQMTRKYLQRLELEDARLVYTAGKYNVARVLIPAESSVPATLRDLGGVLPEQLDVELATTLPADVAVQLPPGVAVVILTDPYRETVPLASANAFLAKALRPAKAAEVSSTLWRLLGESEAAPDGLGVLAFSGPHGERAGAGGGPAAPGHFVELFSANPGRAEQQWSSDRVVADRIQIVPKWNPQAAETLYLPNLDLRYAARDGQPPARYSARAYDERALPRLLSAEERIVNTNGVYCDAMVGRCTALEDYLQRSRDLDLLEKKIQVGNQEIQLRWQAEKEGLDVVLRENNESLLAVVAPRAGVPAFGSRLDLERAQLAERQQIAANQLDRQRQETELELLRHKVAQLQARLGLPREVRIDAPAGSTVAVEATVNLDSDDDAAAAVVVE